jgi:phosphomannomutase
MPEISRFYGIVIRMYYDEHNPPHFHAKYGDTEGVIAIESLRLVQGDLPRRALGLVLDWAELHRGDLLENWERMRNAQAFKKIDPLS